MSDTEFLRARTPEQRERRRELILDVTRELLAQKRVADVSLNEIARHVGLAKSNVLRYFGSREAILLSILNEDYHSWVDDAEHDLSAGLSTAEAARILAESALGRPLMCELLSCTATVLEHNVTVDEVVAFKVAMYEHMARLMTVLRCVTGHDDESDTGFMLVALHSVIAECWAITNPSAVLVQAAQRDPRIIGAPRDAGAFLARTIALVLDGSTSPKP